MKSAYSAHEALIAAADKRAQWGKIINAKPIPKRKRLGFWAKVWSMIK